MSAGLLKSSVVNKLQVYGDLNIKQTKKLVITYDHLTSHTPYEPLPSESYHMPENTAGAHTITVISPSIIEVTFSEVIFPAQLNYHWSGHDPLSGDAVVGVVQQVSDNRVQITASDLTGSAKSNYRGNATIILGQREPV